MQEKKYVPKKELSAFCVAGMGQGMNVIFCAFCQIFFVNNFQVAFYCTNIILLYCKKI